MLKIVLFYSNYCYYVIIIIGCGNMNEPLAIMMRPNKLSDVIGQKHLLGENKVLYNLILLH